MRRALLTADSVHATFDFGGVAASGSYAASAGYLYVDKNSSSPSAGVITRVDWYTRGAAGTQVTFVVGSLAGNTFTVRSTFTVTATATGVNTSTVSLPVQAGDYFGAWSAAANGAEYSATSGVFGYAASGAPSGSVNLTLATGTLQAHLYAT